jgi:hypothetical protein
VNKKLKEKENAHTYITMIFLLSVCVSVFLLKIYLLLQDIYYRSDSFLRVSEGMYLHNFITTYKPDQSSLLSYWGKICRV